MQIILANYDGGYYSECLIAKRRIAQDPLIGFICTYIQESEYKKAYDALQKFLDDYGIEENIHYYDLICVDNGTIERITFNENFYSSKIMEYAVLTFEGDTRRGSFEI